MNDHNRRITLQAVRVHGPLTLLDLRTITGLSTSKVAKIANQLLVEQLLMEDGRLQRHRGPAAKRFAVNPDGCFSIGLSIDRDRITLVFVDFLGDVRARFSRDIALADPRTVRSLLEQSVPEWLERAEIPRERLIGLGVALSDDIARPRLLDQPIAYASWAFVPVDELIHEVFNIPVFVENNVAAAAIGEAQLGLGLQYRSFFYLLVAEALSGGLVADGKYFRGTDGGPEIDWLNAGDGAATGDGPRNIVSLPCLYDRLARRGFKVATQSGLCRLVPAARTILDEWIEESAAALTQPILAINCLIRPDAVVIGARLPAPLVDGLAGSLNRRIAALMGETAVVAPVVCASACADASAVGAAVLPFRDRWLKACSAGSLLLEDARLRTSVTD